MRTLKSPLTNKDNVVCERSIKTSDIIELYKKEYNIDLNSTFNGITYISLYKCLDTNYRFYYPFHLQGDDRFYSALSKENWYYRPWKWEHEQCKKFIKDDFKLLEVGAGSGSFINKISQYFKNIECVGLEFNTSAIEIARNSGINLLNESIEIHSNNKQEYYDLVCSFQVLEHISEVYPFIEAQLKCLKKGGKLLISVPNNDSFLKENTLNSKILNMPPHHMGLWNEKSLTSLTSIFNIKLEKILFEPLQVEHYDTYQYTIIKKIFLNIDWIAQIYWRLHWKLGLHKIFRIHIKNNSHKIIGHTIIAVYQK